MRELQNRVAAKLSRSLRPKAPLKLKELLKKHQHFLVILSLLDHLRFLLAVVISLFGKHCLQVVNFCVDSFN